MLHSAALFLVIVASEFGVDENDNVAGNVDEEGWQGLSGKVLGLLTSTAYCGVGLRLRDNSRH